MPMEDPNSIDMILKKGEDGRVILVIMDAGITTDPAQRLQCLTAKLKAYVSGIFNGSLEDNYPNHTAKDFKIRVVCVTRPTPEMAQIAHVTPSGDPANRMPVEFEEFETGCWDRPQPEASFSETFDSSRLEEIDKELAEEEDDGLTPVQRTGRQGMIVASLALMQGRKDFLFVVFPSAEGFQTVYISEDSATEESMNRANEYARNLPLSVPCCAVVADADEFPIEGKRQTAVIMLTYERGQENGMLFAMPFRRKGRLLGYKQ